VDERAGDGIRVEEFAELEAGGIDCDPDGDELEDAGARTGPASGPRSGALPVLGSSWRSDIVVELFEFALAFS
jgi:hypothetical protein